MVAVTSACSSWSAASISTSRSTVSSGGPARRITSPLSTLPPGLGVRALRLRLSVSGLYWKMITLASGLNGSTPTMAPFITLGEPGKVVIGYGPFGIHAQGAESLAKVGFHERAAG